MVTEQLGRDSPLQAGSHTISHAGPDTAKKWRISRLLLAEFRWDSHRVRRRYSRMFCVKLTSHFHLCGAWFMLLCFTENTLAQVCVNIPHLVFTLSVWRQAAGPALSHQTLYTVPLYTVQPPAEYRPGQGTTIQPRYYLITGIGILWY